MASARSGSSYATAPRSPRIHIVREDVRTFAGLSFSLPTDPIFTPATAMSKQDAIETVNLPVSQCSAYFKANPAPDCLPSSSSFPIS